MQLDLDHHGTTVGRDCRRPDHSRVSHVGPDGDAVGSLLGMYWMLDHLDKTPTAALADPVPDNLTHVPGADRIVGPRRRGR